MKKYFEIYIKKLGALQRSTNLKDFLVWFRFIYLSLSLERSTLKSNKKSEIIFTHLLFFYTPIKISTKRSEILIIK